MSNQQEGRVTCDNCIHAEWQKTPTGKIKKNEAGRCLVKVPKVAVPVSVAMSRSSSTSLDCEIDIAQNRSGLIPGMKHDCPFHSTNAFYTASGLDGTKQPEWKDTTSYSSGERGTKEPSCFSFDISQFRITVLCGYRGYPKDVWLMHCPSLGLDSFVLDGVKTAEEAKAESLKVIENYIVNLTAGLAIARVVTEKKANEDARTGQ